MPLVRSKPIRHDKLRRDNGNVIEVKIWRIRPSNDKPHGYKYSLVYIAKGKRVFGYDNSEGKGDHKHYGNKEETYKFKGIDRLFEDFYCDVKEAGDED